MLKVMIYDLQLNSSTTQFFVFQQSFFVEHNVSTRKLGPSSGIDLRIVKLSKQIRCRKLGSIVPIRTSVSRDVYPKKAPSFRVETSCSTKTIAGRRRTLLLNVKPAKMSVFAPEQANTLFSDFFSDCVLFYLVFTEHVHSAQRKI